MEISQFALAELYILAAIVGIGLGVCYDMLRITRVFLGVHYSRRAKEKLRDIRLPFLKAKKERKESPILGTVIFFEDLFFGLLCGVAMILLFYEANNGKFRFPAIICAMGGFFLYRATLGRLVMLFSEVIAFFIGALARYVCFFSLFPFKWLAGRIYASLHATYTKAKAKAQRRQRESYTKFQEERAASACGMVPREGITKRKLKRGHAYGSKTNEAVQPEHVDANLSRHHRRGLLGRVRQ